jgi:enamine deaminase RidA (YjgF/YER057c/UK114 family)
MNRLVSIRTALEACGADHGDVVKGNVRVVTGQHLQPAREPFMKMWSQRPNPPAITAAIAIGLARPEFLVEIDAVAVVKELR